MRAQREVVVLVPRKSRQIEHDHEMDAAFIQPAERQQILKLAAIGGLGAFAFLVKAFENLVALATTVLLARAKLSRQAEILGVDQHVDAAEPIDHGPYRRLGIDAARDV
jgi:hypothetical protein